MTYANGDLYQGEFVNNKRHGKGWFRTAANEVYDGEWRDDVKLTDY